MGGVSDAKFSFIYMATRDSRYRPILLQCYLKIVSHINNIKLENKQKTYKKIKKCGTAFCFQRGIQKVQRVKTKWQPFGGVIVQPNLKRSKNKWLLYRWIIFIYSKYIILELYMLWLCNPWPLTAYTARLYIWEDVSFLIVCYCLINFGLILVSPETIGLYDVQQ